MRAYGLVLERAIFRGLVIAMALAAAGCGQLITAAMVHAPNRGDEMDTKPTPAWVLRCNDVDREMWVEVGPPSACLRVWVIEPNRAAERERADPKGTILVLHGYRASMRWISGMGRGFAKAGYRVVLVESRGHGRSSGDYITYGVIESRDAGQVIDFLKREGLIAGRLGVWGISMGAATAIQLASRDSRPETVVAVAPYTSMRQVVPGVVRLLMPIYGWLASEETIRGHVDAAGEKADFNPDDADTLAAVQNVTIPTLILHGKNDWVVPPEHGRELHEANPRHTRLLEIPWTGHIAAHFSNRIERESVEWFDRWLP
jgi:pimeloyl-ACP methyl ester carboxylesterase